MTNLLGTRNPRIGSRISNFNTRLGRKTLNFELDITCSEIKRLEQRIRDFATSASNVLPHFIVEEFKFRQSVAFNKTLNTIKRVNTRKFEQLKMDVNRDAKFRDNSGWFINLTNVVIPENISDFLSLGPKFSWSPNKTDIKINRIIANVESILDLLPENTRNNSRARITNILTNFLQNDDERGFGDGVWGETRRFLKDNPDVLIMNADKGAVTVAISKVSYHEKATALLSDESTYKELKSDPTFTIQKKNNDLVKLLKRQGLIDDIVAKKLTIYNSNFPKFYALTKIHKPGNPLRPIVASINTPTSNLSGFASDILTEALGSHREYNVKNSFEFSTTYNKYKLPPGYVLVSFDVVSLFTNIPLELVLDIVTIKWHVIEEHCSLTLEYFIMILKFIFSNCYFCYDGKFYSQIFGTPMGSVISPILANIVMDHLLDTVIAQLDFDVAFVRKYVDDLIVGLPADKVDSTLTLLNSFNTHIQFTVEREDEARSVPFLDTKLYREEDGTIYLDWYQKPTASGRYINYFSNHPLTMKTNIIVALKNRISKICDERFLKNNLDRLCQILCNNGYPKNLVKKLVYNSNQVVDVLPIEPPQQKVYRKLPFIPEITSKLVSVLRSDNIQIANYNVKCIGQLFSKMKTKTPPMLGSNVVYSIPCGECNLVYVGQTTQWLRSRITQHRSDIKINKKSCALAIHANTSLHKPNLEAVKILDVEPNYKTRLCLELLHINQQQHSMNFRTDMEGLNAIYSHIIHINNNNNNVSTS